MSSKETAPSSENVITGIHTDFVLDNLSGELEQYLDSHQGPESLFRMHAEELRYPVEDAELEFYKNAPDDLSLDAYVTFDSLSVRGQNIRNWKNRIGRVLKERFDADGLRMYRLQHQTHDFYVRINDVHAVHVQFETTTTDCRITTTLENLSQLAFASDDKFRFDPDPDDATAPPHIETLRRFVATWSHVIDAVTDTLGSPEHEHVEKSRIVITPASQVRQEEPEKTKELELANPKAPREPLEIETTSRPDGFDLIGGLSDAKRRLQDIAETFNDPVGSFMYGLSPSHFLLHGPAGTGKSSLIDAFVDEIGARLWAVDTTSLVDMYVGNSGKNVKELFNALKQQRADKPIVVVMDEFDAIGQKGNASSRERKDVIKLLNTSIDDLSRNHKHIIIAGAMNADVDDIEPALVRSGRLEPIGAPAPNDAERVDVWSAVLAQSFLAFNHNQELTSASLDDTPSFIPYGDDIDPIGLSSLTDGMTGADFEVILARARKAQHRLYRQTGEPGRVSQADIIHQISNFGR